jgi:hypothetical protein
MFNPKKGPHITTTKHFLIMSMLISSSALFCAGMQDIKSPQEFIQKIQELQKLDIRSPSIIEIFKENITQCSRAPSVFDCL